MNAIITCALIICTSITENAYRESDSSSKLNFSEEKVASFLKTVDPLNLATKSDTLTLAMNFTEDHITSDLRSHNPYTKPSNNRMAIKKTNSKGQTQAVENTMVVEAKATASPTASVCMPFMITKTK
ncbi:hypothetical protein [Jiulongibacter sp. NS-SX5]|uniref:hypothetical protein n=1 Tax=Jiulongibacter sp. NS-SX5 TaxID=3463854 RepID=UPI00405885FA